MLKRWRYGSWIHIFWTHNLGFNGGLPLVVELRSSCRSPNTLPRLQRLLACLYT
jgi:hypothetical protein